MRKFRCLKNDIGNFTVGKIYAVNKSGCVSDDHGHEYKPAGYETAIGWLEANGRKFSEVLGGLEDSCKIKEVLYGTRTTIIKWSDGTQTEAVCSPEDNFDKQVGFSIAYTRKMNGGKLSE